MPVFERAAPTVCAKNPRPPPTRPRPPPTRPRPSEAVQLRLRGEPPRAGLPGYFHSDPHHVPRVTRISAYSPSQGRLHGNAGEPGPNGLSNCCFVQRISATHRRVEGPSFKTHCGKPVSPSHSTMDSKEETSDTDSGIILHSGPDSPTSPVKELAVHTRAVRLKHQALEGRLERCLQELKQLCVREAELTGEMPPEYPLQPGETPPRVRHRVGAASGLNNDGVQQGGQDLELVSLEAKLALQQQILQAACKLSLEQNLSRLGRRSRLQQCKHEEEKLKDPQRTRSQHTAQLPVPLPLLESPLPPLQIPKQTPPQTLELQRPAQKAGMGYERTPIQNSPWSESSLDQPYQKCRKPHSAGSSCSCSPPVTPSSMPMDPYQRDILPLPPLAPTLGLTLDDGDPHSAPCTPALHQHCLHPQSFRWVRRWLPRHDASDAPDTNVGCARLSRRRASDFAMSPPPYPSSSEDSSSEHSVPSHRGSPCREGSKVPPKPPPPPYGYHLLARQNGPYGDTPRITRHHSNGPQTSRRYSGHQGGVQAPSGSSFCKHPQVQSPPSIRYEGVYPGDLDVAGLYLRIPPPLIHPPPSRFEYWQEEGLPRQVPRAPPLHVWLARGPSLKEYTLHHGGGQPQGLVCEELHSWRHRSQTHENQPQSLDRLGAEREHQHQAPGRRILLRAPDGTPVQWYEEEDCEIVSQV
ncbi:hypothetical protein GN956_G9659 [Arapaima gigas]